MSVKLNLRNQIINGSFEYFQRNITFATVANNTYTADRWVYNKVGSAVHTVARSADVPTNSFGIYSLLIDCTTAQASIASTDYVSIEQRIEGNMLRNIKGKKILLSFWVKATKTGTYCVSFRNATDTRSFVKEYTVNTTNTWEKKTVRLEHDASGSWNYDHQLGMRVSFVIAAGTNFHTSENAWQGGDYLSTSNQVNGVDNIANDFQIADVMLVEDNRGQTREPEFQLAGRDFAEELQLCQRYFEKSYNLDVAPGTASDVGYFSATCNDGVAHNRRNAVTFKILKRVAPSVKTYDLVGTVNSMTGWDNGNGQTNNYAAPILVGVGTAHFSANTFIAAAYSYGFHYTADAEL